MSHRDEHLGDLPPAMQRLFDADLTDVEGEECLSEGDLADWLDDALSTRQRESALAHLARCRGCQARLVALHRDTESAWSAGTSVPVVEQRPAGERVDWPDPPSSEAESSGPAVGRAGLEKSKDQNDLDDEERKRRFVSGQS